MQALIGAGQLRRPLRHPAFQFCMRFLQILLRPLLPGDVAGDADHPDHLSLAISQRDFGGEQPAPGVVRPEGRLLPIDERLPRLHHHSVVGLIAIR